MVLQIEMRTLLVTRDVNLHTDANTVRDVNTARILISIKAHATVTLLLISYLYSYLLIDVLCYVLLLLFVRHQ